MTQPEPEVEIRPYRPEDRNACRALWVELTEWHREIYSTPEIGGHDPGAQFDEHLAKVGPSNVWVAVAGDDVVGLTGVIPGEREAELEPLVVTAGLRGRGIGTLLANHVLDVARRAGWGSLSVRPVARNAEAIRFFHSRGFGVLGHLEMFVDLGPGSGPWQEGETLAERAFLI